MATKTATTYFCDSCEGEKARTDLRRFDLEEKKMNGDMVVRVRMDLCTGCEVKLHEALRPLMAADQYERIEGIARP
jgi:hypothetical protein